MAAFPAVLLGYMRVGAEQRVSSLPGHFQLDAHAPVPRDGDPDVRFDAEHSFQEPVQRADRVRRDQAHVVVPCALGLLPDPGPQRLEHEPAEEEPPMGVTIRS
jgi:hypothetical protein